MKTILDLTPAELEQQAQARRARLQARLAHLPAEEQARVIRLIELSIPVSAQLTDESVPSRPAP